MKHRHLVDGVGFTPASIDDILDRGTQADWAELYAEVARDPFGRIAEDILKMCAWHDMYGTSRLWPAMSARLRDKTIVPDAILVGGSAAAMRWNLRPGGERTALSARC